MGVSEDVIPYINILLLGPVGAGKSSFFNTLNSFFRERLSIQARAGSSDTSLTRSVSNQLKVKYFAVWINKIQIILLAILWEQTVHIGWFVFVFI